MNSRVLLLFVAFFGVTLNCLAQFKISGKIVNSESKHPINGALIYFTDVKISAATNENGVYQTLNLKGGNYLIEVSSNNYKSIIQVVSISKDTIIDFQLELATKELSEVVVTGVTRSTELKLSPIIIATIGKDELNENGSTNIIDGLKNIPGISQVTTGAAISKPVIRGLGYNRVIVLNNGIRQEGQQWGDEHGVEIDEYGVDRVEIVKGPGSLMYGSDGIAGVVNFVAPKAPSNGEIKTQLVSNYQSNSNLFGNSISNAGTKKDIQWLARFSNKESSNYQNKFDGKVYNSGFSEVDGSLFLGVNKKWGHSHINISTYNTRLNLIEGERDSLGKFVFMNSNGIVSTAQPNDLNNFDVGFPHQKINHLRMASNSYFILKNGTINLDLGIQNNKRREFGDVQNPQYVALFFDLTTFNYSGRYNIKKIKGWETSIGIGGMYQSNLNKGLEFLIPEYALFDAGAFVFTQKTIKKCTFAGGVRFDNRNFNSDKLYLDSLNNPTTEANPNSFLKFQSIAKNYAGFSGSLGLSYQISKISTLKINVSRGFRAPNSAELASNGRHEGAFRYEIGNENLKSEISHQFDVAYFLNSDHISFELTPFVNSISNYIYTEKLKNSVGFDSIPDPSDPAPAYVFTTGKATVIGGEIYFDIHPHPLDWLHLANSFSYVQATQKNQPDSSRYLPFIPAPKYRGEVRCDFKKFGNTLTDIYLKFNVDCYFKQDKVFSANGTETSTPAYNLLSIGLGATVKAFNRIDFLKINLSAENLTNVAYQNHLSRLKYAPQNIYTGRNGVFNMGRNISLKLTFNF